MYAAEILINPASTPLMWLRILKNVDAQIWKEIARNLNQKFVYNVFNNRKPNIPFGSMISTVEKLVEDEETL